MLELIIPPHYPLGRAVATHPDLGSFRFGPRSGRPFFSLMRPNADEANDFRAQAQTLCAMSENG